MPLMRFIIPFIIICLHFSCKKDENKVNDPPLTVDSVFVNNVYVSNNAVINSIDYDDLRIRLKFNRSVDTSQFNRNRLFFSSGIGSEYLHYFGDDAQNLIVSPAGALNPLSSYRMTFEQGENLGGTVFNFYTLVFRTVPDSTPKFPIVTDDELLTLVQEKTFGYFWDYGHPVSGLARERLGSGELVTSGGSGFGLMAIITGIERNFISRQEGFERLRKTVNFLIRPETDKYHGAFPHWLNGTTGKTIPFSSRDNGGDLVETAFLMQGMITVREYFRNGSAEERAMCDSIQKLWENVDWNWYRKNSENVLYWHWSPVFSWELNHQIRGWNEALIVYVLAAASPTHSIPTEAYHQGWGRNGSYPMKNGKTFYNIVLPLGEDLGGPLFFAHYSFMGLDPSVQDIYANYFAQNEAHSLINYRYCIDNPKNYVGYSKDCWGLTASDIESGYTANSPNNDRGVIAPAAAIGSFPYTPEESMDALKFFYYVLGDRIWGEYGFYDAFNLTTLWFADSYLAIDQGPVICMIENHRSGLLWDLFMSSPEIQAGLDKLSFTIQP